MRVGKVTVYLHGKTWWTHFREESTTRRVRIGTDREEAERRAAEVNAQLACGVPSAYGFERVPPRARQQLRRPTSGLAVPVEWPEAA